MRQIFEDMSVGFRPKNQKIRKAYINEMVNLLKTMCQSPEKLSEEDMIDVGFKFDRLKTKLNELSELDWAIKDLPAFRSDTFVIGGCKW